VIEMGLLAAWRYRALYGFPDHEMVISHEEQALTQRAQLGEPVVFEVAKPKGPARRLPEFP
jgi:hypothetical protein